MYLSPPAPSRISADVAQPPIVGMMPPMSMPGLPTMAASPQRVPPKVVAPRAADSAVPADKAAAAAAARPKPRRVAQVSPKQAWSYLVGQGSTKQVLLTRAILALLVMIVTTVVLVAASPRSVRITKTSPDGVTTSRPCIATAFGIGALAFGVTLGVPFAIEFLRPPRK